MVLRKAFAARPRLWRALQAAACVWLPPLLALVCSPLAECRHCLGVFGVWYPLAPGVLAGLLAAPAGGGSEATLWLAAPATLGLWWAAGRALAARSKLVRTLVPAAAAVVAGASGIVFGQLLRM